MRDAAGIVQLWTVSPLGGEPEQLTHDPWDIASAFTWSPDGHRVAYIADGSVFVASAETGDSRRLTLKRDAEGAPRPEACVFSPDGRSIAYVRPVASDDGTFNHVFKVPAGE
jgi:Tol biopolymer transport system component